MSDEQKTLKDYAKEAKKRLKQGFWQSYHENLNSELINNIFDQNMKLINCFGSISKPIIFQEILARESL